MNNIEEKKKPEKKKLSIEEEYEILNTEFDLKDDINLFVYKNMKTLEYNKAVEMSIILTSSIVLGVFLLSIPFLFFYKTIFGHIINEILYLIPFGYLDLRINNLFYLITLPVFLIFFIIYPYRIMKKKKRKKVTLLFLCQIVLFFFLSWLIIVINFHSNRENICKYLPEILKTFMTIIYMLISFFITINLFTKPILAKKEIDYSKNEMNARYNLISRIIQILTISGDLKQKAKNNTIIELDKPINNIIFQMQECKKDILNLKYLSVNNIDFLQKEIFFEKAMNAFDLKVRFKFNRNTYTLSPDVENELKSYLHMFWNKDLESLPIFDNPIVEKKYKTTIKHYIFYGLYISIPLIIYIILCYLKIISNNYEFNGILKYTYLSYVIIGTISNPFIYNKLPFDKISNIFSIIKSGKEINTK